MIGHFGATGSNLLWDVDGDGGVGVGDPCSSWAACSRADLVHPVFATAHPTVDRPLIPPDAAEPLPRDPLTERLVGGVVQPFTQRPPDVEGEPAQHHVKHFCEVVALHDEVFAASCAICGEKRPHDPRVDPVVAQFDAVLVGARPRERVARCLHARTHWPGGVPVDQHEPPRRRRDHDVFGVSVAMTHNSASPRSRACNISASSSAIAGSASRNSGAQAQRRSPRASEQVVPAKIASHGQCFCERVAALTRSAWIRAMSAATLAVNFAESSPLRGARPSTHACRRLNCRRLGCVIREFGEASARQRNRHRPWHLDAGFECAHLQRERTLDRRHIVRIREVAVEPLDCKRSARRFEAPEPM